MEKRYILDFDGHWDESELQALPEYPGIYGVFVSSFGLLIDRVIYIGRAANINERFKSHHDWDSWREELGDNDRLMINAAKLEAGPDQIRVEAALIYKLQPTCNNTGKANFQFSSTRIATLGKNDAMCDDFIV